MCLCKQGISNTGTPDCSSGLEVPVKMFIVPKYDNTGTKNGINITSYLAAAVPKAYLNDAYFSALINQSNVSKRWYPTPELKNVDTVRGDDRTESARDGSIYFLGQGVRSFTMIIMGKDASPQLYGKLKSVRCNDAGVYIGGESGSLIGSDEDAGYLRPINIDENSWSVKYNWATDEATQKIEIKFNLAASFKDENLRAIKAEEMECNILGLRGLMNANVTVVSCGQTSTVVDIFTDFGTAVAKIPVEGLVVADFISSVGGATSKIRDTADNADVTLTSISESTTIPGRYTLNYASQTIGNVLQPLISKTGFDASGMIGTVGTVA